MCVCVCVCVCVCIHILAALVFVAAHGLSLVVVSGGSSLVTVWGLLIVVGSRGLQALRLQ